MRRDPFSDRPRIPIFFKLWFAFVAILAVGIIAGQIWLGATVLTNPEQVGRFFADIAKGFNEVQP